MSWKHENIITAAAYLSRLIAAGAEDCVEIRDGLLEVLDPEIRRTRLERLRELDQMDAHGEKPSGRIYP